MRELTINHTAPTIRINDRVYEILMGDAEIMAMMDEAKEAVSGVDPNDTRRILEKARYLADCIDRILGDGAVKAISGGKAVNVADLVQWFNLIASNALAARFDRLVEEND